MRQKSAIARRKFLARVIRKGCQIAWKIATRARARAHTHTLCLLILPRSLVSPVSASGLSALSVPIFRP